MGNQVQLIVYPVKNLDVAKSFYTSYLGIQPYAENEYYVGYRLGTTEIGLDPNALTIVSYINVTDLKSTLETLQTVGVNIVKDSTDVGGGLLIAQVEIDGNVMGLRQQPQS